MGRRGRRPCQDVSGHTVTPPLFDTHCHLQDPRLAEDLEGVLARGEASGVTGMVCCATRPADWEGVLDLAARHPAVLPMLGLHPWYLGAAGPTWREDLDRRLRDGRAGVGECGLDFVLDGADRGAQEAAFRAQLELAVELDRPLSIHCRRAWEALVAALQETGLPAAGTVIHAFSGSPETARRLQDLGCHLAFGCTLAHPGNRRGPAALRAVDPERLLFESDAPDLPPRHLPEYAGDQPNEPKNLALVLDAAARILGTDREILARRVQANAERVFGRLRP